MIEILEPGDLVIQKSAVSESLFNSAWYQETYGEVLIVERAGEPQSHDPSHPNDQSIILKDNEYIWSNYWLEKIEQEVFHEKEFEI